SFFLNAPATTPIYTLSLHDALPISHHLARAYSIAMTTAVANPPDQNLRQYLIYSIIMHGSLAVVIAVSAYIQYHGKAWGGVGGNLGGAKVSLVSSAGIPMPKESVVTESKAVDP